MWLLIKEAEDIFMRMTKKFANNQEVWIKYAIFHYKNSNCELARKLLIRSFGSLDKKERKWNLKLNLVLVFYGFHLYLFL